MAAAAAAAAADLRALLASSAFVRHVRASRELCARAFFPLSASDVAELRANGNTADDWAQVRKTYADAPVSAAQIRGCSFRGRVVLGAFSRAARHDVDGVPFASGLYQSTLCDVVVLDDALVLDSLALCGVLLEPRASVVRCGSVLGAVACASALSSAPTRASTPRTPFGNGQTLHVGVESGGRDVRAVADLPFALAARIATERDNAALLDAYDALVNDYVAALTATDGHGDGHGDGEQPADLTIVCSDAQLLRCARIEASYIGESAVVDDCDVRCCSLLSSKEQRTVLSGKSLVRHALVQPGAGVCDLSVVERALLSSGALVQRHAVVMSAVLGAGTAVAEGEVTASLVGPLVGFHHQALLIASVWPEGKGNVGYGANVGSNHTLKAPDQELRPGEGVFFGLGCNVKFPADLRASPYAVIATAVTTLPQRLAMPFALINTPGHAVPGLSPAINEISPGWVLASSIFTVLRNERKFRARAAAAGSARVAVETEILNRADIVELMKRARAALVAVTAAETALVIPETGERVFTDRHVKGIGKNYLRESARVAGVTAYAFFIRLFALENLLAHIERGTVRVDDRVGSLAVRCEYELKTLAEEYPADKPVGECLRELVDKKAAVAKSAVAGKARDDKRGERVITDYNLVHTPADDTAVVRDARRAADDVRRRVGAFLPRV